MKGFKSCGLFALSFAVLLTGLYPFSSVNAASEHDNALQITNSIPIQFSYPGTQICPEVDIAADWGSIIVNSSYGDSFQQALQTGSWGITTQSFSMQLSQGTYTDNFATAFWVENTTGSSTTFHNSYVQVNSPDQIHTLKIGIPETGGCDIVTSQYQTPNSFQISSENGGNKLFLSTFPVTYPVGYEGQLVPDSANIKTKLYPDVEYQVQDKKLKAIYKKNIPNGSHVSWMIYKADNDWNTEDNPHFTKINQPLSSGSVFDYEFEDRGKYTLFIGISTLPPYLPFPDDIEVMPRVIRINIDGTTFSGSTDGEECNDGYCEEISPYEDCSTYGTDIIGGIGCHFRNFGVLIRIILTFLFVPDTDNTEYVFSIIFDGFKNTLGFIYDIVEFVVRLVGGFLFPSTSLQICNWQFGSFFNNNFSLNICSFEQNFPSSFNTVKFTIQAFTVFGLISGIYMEYRRIIRA